MNAIEDNRWSKGFRELASLLPRPAAILAVSAHWYLPGTYLTGNDHPETIHDFGGFPDALYAMTYPAPGDLRLAQRVMELLGESRASLNSDWGIDHGTWSVLHHMFPDADVPVVQLSIHSHLPESGHFDLGRALTPLRDEGVLIMASGNIVHNLRDAFARYQSGDMATPGWAMEFDEHIAQAIERHDHPALIRALRSPEGKLAHPTPDHYLPLLYAVGAASSAEQIAFPITGFDMGSLSMRAVLFA
jgi:4,5-DOPA dioxygenase extradiol